MGGFEGEAEVAGVSDFAFEAGEAGGVSGLKGGNLVIGLTDMMSTPGDFDRACWVS